VRCPGCFSLERVGGKLCAQCGTPLELEGLEGPIGLGCPRCTAVELTGVSVGEHRVGECLHCTGLFVEHAVLERITRTAERTAGLRLRPLELPPTGPEGPAYLLCPRCGVHMGRKAFGERSGIIVDVCARHGVWFDREELARAVEFVAARGAGGALAEAQEARARRLRGDSRVGGQALDSYDMVGSFLRSLLRD